VVRVSAAGLAAAASAGLLSFLSPCVLPVVPGYLAVLAGFDGTGPSRRPRALRNAALFCTGFSAVFVLLGLTATAAGGLLGRHHALLTRMSGVLVLLMALYLAGSLLLRRPGLYGDHRFHPRVGAVAAPVAGAAFALGWSPCLGPVLGSILAVAATQGRAAAGAGLLAAYSAGLSLSFLAAALFYRQVPGPGRLRRWGPAVTVVSSAALAVLGVLLLLDRLGWLAAQLQPA
jgi:cytochrome c-type biogenesis protein